MIRKKLRSEFLIGFYGLYKELEILRQILKHNNIILISDLSK